jgi:transposase
VKGSEDVMEILEAYDLLQSIEGAARDVGCDPKTVRRYVLARDLGREASAVHRAMLIDPHLDKVEEWVDRSRGQIRADVCHRKLQGLGYTGSERTTRRAVARAKQAYAAGHRRVYRPWVPEPGMWFQWDWGEGPRVGGRRTSLWCAWLAWSRFRVVIPTWDRTLPTLVACLDQTVRTFGGVPTYGLTDNEKTVTVEHVARIPVRHPQVVAAGRHYGIQIRTCAPADAETKGGAEATVRIAKADLVPTATNLLEDYATFEELREAAEAFCDRVNARPHRETHRPPAQALAEERLRLHPVPAEPHALALGQTRSVDTDATIRFGSARYSVPHTLVGERVWVRVQGHELVVTHAGGRGVREVARHQLTTPGTPRIDPAHYPERPDPLQPRPRPVTAEERAFLALGDGAHQWLVEAAASGATRVRAKMARATELAALVGTSEVDRALGHAATAGRFSERDLQSILEHLRQGRGPAQPVLFAPEGFTTQPGTAAWEALGR